MHRKEFLKYSSKAALLAASPSLYSFTGSKKAEDHILTATGSITKEQMGFTLAHEHILSIFGTDAQEPARYNNAQALTEVVPYLTYLKSLGCDTIVDCSAAYLGRNAKLIRQISRQSGVQILISTGIYGAAGDRYVPDYAYKESAGQLAGRWIEEFKQGIQGTTVKPGFLKSGVDAGPLSEIDAKLVRAAAITHLETGLLLQIHTSDNPVAARQQLEILRKEGVSPEAWVWVHAQNMSEAEPLVEAAKQGAWISLDGLRTPNFLNNKRSSNSTLMHHYKLVSAFKEAGMLDHLLLSHDGSSYPPEGTDKRPMDVLMNSFIPMLKAGGFSKEEIDLITVKNPADAFSIGIKKY